MHVYVDILRRPKFVVCVFSVVEPVYKLHSAGVNDLQMNVGCDATTEVVN